MKTINKILKSKKGFTLIELVVVIAVLGMIAVVAVPKIAGITDKAKTASDAQTIAVLNEAVERYEAETGEEVTETDDKSAAQFWLKRN
jgi:prepilin-type N-terminal cleavage/methylation domain